MRRMTLTNLLELASGRTRRSGFETRPPLHAGCWLGGHESSEKLVK